jgi:hypothetical protein
MAKSPPPTTSPTTSPRASAFHSKAGTVILLCLAAVSGAQAAGSSPKPLDIQVQARAFGWASTSDITAVLKSAGGELWRYCPAIQLAGIDVYRRTDHPQTDFKRMPDGRIAVGLTAHDTLWAQYSFQFAHEFCHVLANYSETARFARYSPHANMWLEESLCETASLFTLRAMARSWQAQPPYPAWQSYAPWFTSYVGQRLAPRDNHLQAGTPFPVWFRANEPALRQNSNMRDRNTVVALQLLPLFEADPRGWEALAFLNRGAHAANESLRERLTEWRSRSPNELRPFISRLAAVFAVKL